MRTFTRFLAPLLAAGVVLSGPSASADGIPADECSSTVWRSDDAQQLDVSAIDSQVRKLEDLGADVRVRTYGPGVDGDERFDELLASCESWQALDGEQKGNLLVYLLTPETVVVTVGSNWFDEISEDEQESIRLAANGNPEDTDAVLAMMRKTLEVVATTGTSSSPTGGTDGPNVSAAGIGKVLLGLLVLVVLAGAAFVAYRLWQKRKLARWKQKAAQEARDEADAAIGALVSDEDSPDKDFGVRFELSAIEKDLSEADLAELREMVDAAVTAGNAVLVRNGQLKDLVTMNPDVKHSAEQYDKIAATYDEFLPEILKAQAFLDVATERFTALELRINEASARLALQVQDFVSTRQEYEQLKSQGHKLDDSDLDDIQARLDAAQTHVDAGTPGKALPDIDAADEMIDTLETRFDYLHGIVGDLTKRCDTLTKLRQETVTNLDEAAKTLQRLQADYAPSCWQDLVVTHHDTMLDLSKVSTALDRAKECMSMDQQDWDGATSELDWAQQRLEAVNGVVYDVGERGQRLSELEHSLMGDVTELRSQIDTTVSTAGHLKGEHDDSVAALRLLSDETVRLAGELQADKPDYLGLATKVAHTKQAFEEVEAQMQAEHDAIVRREAEAAERARQAAEAEAQAQAAAERRRRQRDWDVSPGMSFPTTSRRGSSGGGGGFSRPSSSSGRKSSGSRSSSGGRKSSGRRR